MNGFSKTTELCDCGWICQALNEKDSGVVFEQNSFWFKMPSGGQFILWHCPFCGGAFPDYDKPLWAPIMSSEERQTLENLGNPISAPGALFEKLGKPDYDATLTDGTRNIEYYGLSKLANLEFYFYANGSSERRIVMKPISARHLTP